MYAVVDQMPTYLAGGNEGLAAFIRQNFRYPVQHLRDQVEGKTYVALIIDRSGRIRRPVIVRALTQACDAEVLRLVGLLGEFAPGRLNGQPVDVLLVWPFDFTMR